jgi:signal transduction histidine kinase
MILFLKRLFAWRSPASLAFAATVALAYFSLWDDPTLRLTSQRGILCLGAGALYALFGTIDYGCIGRTWSYSRKLWFLGLQSGLLLAIICTSRLTGEMSLCIYPLVAATVTLLPSVSAAFGVALLYALQVGVEYHFYGISGAERWSLWTIPGFGFVVIFTRIAIREKEARARAEALSLEIEQLAVIKERNRLAREIHDGLGHFLTSIHVQLEAAKTVYPADPARALEAMAKAQGLTRDALMEVRRSVGALQVDCEPVSLTARLHQLASATEGWGATVTLEVLGEARALSPDAAHTLFRAVQEALTNVRKHAKAQTARVVLDYRDSERICVCVSDDGRGATTISDGRGLKGLRERIADFGGRVTTENSTQGGFCLTVEISA